MTSTTTRTTRTPDDVAQLVELQREFGDWALLGWRPCGGFADPDKLDLHRVQAGLQRLLS
jgi:hypothetical protein